MILNSKSITSMVSFMVNVSYGERRGVVIKPLVCGARYRGFEPRPHHYDFRDWYLLLQSHNVSKCNCSMYNHYEWVSFEKVRFIFG